MPLLGREQLRALLLDEYMSEDVAEQADVAAKGRFRVDPGDRSCGRPDEPIDACVGRQTEAMTGGVPLTIALVAGGLSTLNPCGFPLLPAFLSFYVGASCSPPARR